MEQVCPSCAATPPPGSSFCNGCGHDLSSPMAATLFGEMEMSWWCEQAEALRGRLERGEPFKGFAPYAE